MCTAVTGKGKVSKNLWFQNTTYPHFFPITWRKWLNFFFLAG